MNATKFKPKKVQGFLVSQIGYDERLPKQALLRSTESEWVAGCRFLIRDVHGGKVCMEGEVHEWGEKWGSHWWQVPFTDLDRNGTYRIHVFRENEEITVSDPFDIGPDIVWQKTLEPVAFTQFEQRATQARHGSGWKDCGSDWRECGSHTFALIGQCDLLQFGFDWMPLDQQRRLADIIRTGCRFVCVLMDRARDAGHPEGAVVHEIPNHALVIPGDAASAAMALAYASRLLYEFYPEESTDWLHRAHKAFAFFLEMSPWQDGGFSAINRGLPEGTQPDGMMTRDLMMGLWAGLQLHAGGIAGLRSELFSLTTRILERQIREEEAEAGYWGHFREFASMPHSEKANTHHHVGHDTGSVLSFNVLPLMGMCERFYDDPAVPRIRQAVVNFATHFALPACQANPFGLMPQGVFGTEGLLDFCGPWHGTNVSYGYFSSMAVRLAAFTGLKFLYEAAVGNLQWICGLHSGVTAESMEGCEYWRESIPEGEARAYSQILSVGRRSVGGWTDIPGTIVNGFSTNPQFTLQVTPGRENDGPWLFTDEDWVPHAGGFLSAVAVMRAHFSVPWNHL